MESPPVPRFGQVVFDTTDPRASAEFWRQLLGLVYRQGNEAPPPGADEPAGRDWLILVAPDSARCLAFQKVEVLPRAAWPTAEIPQQLHLDLVANNLEELNAIRERIIDLGGQVL